MSGRDLAASLREACERWAPRPAVTHAGTTLTYEQLWARSTALAAAYRSLGVAPGDRVVCQLPVRPEHLVAIAAAWACGAIHVGADRDLTPRELAGLVERTGAAAVVVEPPPWSADPHGWLREVSEACPGTIGILHGHDPDHGGHRLGDLLSGAPSEPPHPVGPDDTALLLLTSGTTGTAKLVVETLRGLIAKVGFFAEAVPCGAEDVHLIYLPIAHVFGLKLTLMALLTGGRAVLMDRFSPQEALRTVGEERVTVIPGTPTHLVLLLDALDPDRHRVDSLRWTVSAAAPLPPGLYDDVSERLGVRMLYVYGCSEGFLTRTADPGEIRRGSVGREVFHGPDPLPQDGTVQIRDPDDDRPLPVGETGQITFGTTGPVRYWDRAPAATDGTYRSGDLGRLDDDGLLFVSGRLKELINRGGLKVAPREIEAALERHPDVADCAVIATPDRVLGEAICACVVPAGGRVPTLTAVREHLAVRLARHKLPDELCVVSAVPRSAVGKIDRPALAAEVLGDELPRQRFRAAREATQRR